MYEERTILDGLSVGSPDLDAIPLAADPAAVRLAAMVAVARHHGVDLHNEDYRAAVGEDVPSPASMAAWAREQGLWARAERVKWKQLFKLQGATNPPPPVVLLFKDGSAALMVAADAGRDVVWVQEPGGAGQPVPVDGLRLGALWSGEVVLVRRMRTDSEAERPF